MFLNKRKNILIISIIAVIFIFGIHLMLYSNFNNIRKKTKNQAKIYIENTLKQIENQLYIRFETIEHIPQNLKVFIEKTQTTPQEVQDIMCEFIKNNYYINGIANGFEEQIPNKDTFNFKLQYYYRINDSIEYTDEPLVSEMTSEWYSVPKFTKQPYWTEPYIDTLSDYGDELVTQKMISYTLPYFHKNGEFYGILDVDIFLSYISEFLNKISVLNTGSILLISSQKVVISSNNDTLIMKSLRKISKQEKLESFEQLCQAINIQKDTSIITTNFLDTEKAILRIRKLSNGMFICVVFPYNELYKDIITSRQRYRLFAIISFFVIISLSIVSYYVLINNLIKTYNKDLQVEVMQKTTELREKNEELLVSQEELNQLNNNLMSSFEIVEHQRNEIEKLFHKITDNINYAQSIQNALFPNQEILKNNFKEYFLLFKPKDVVSGDFYYFYKVNNYLLFAVGDCTGHGVSGAFMTILSISFLNQINSDPKTNSCSEVLEKMRLYFKKTFFNYGISNQNGLDLAFCAFDIDNNQLYFSGANLPLVIIRNKQLIKLKPNKSPIGFYITEKPYTQTTVNIEPNDIIYMYSDGFQDQLSGHEEIGKLKLVSKNFIQFLVDVSKYPVYEQKDILEHKLIDWQQNEQQTDDIVVWGIKLI